MAHLTPDNRITTNFDLRQERCCSRKKFFVSAFYAERYRDFLEREGYGYFDFYLCNFCLGYHLYRLKEV